MDLKLVIAFTATSAASVVLTAIVTVILTGAENETKPQRVWAYKVLFFIHSRLFRLESFREIIYLQNDEIYQAENGQNLFSSRLSEYQVSKTLYSFARDSFSSFMHAILIF